MLINKAIVLEEFSSSNIKDNFSRLNLVGVELLPKCHRILDLGSTYRHQRELLQYHRERLQGRGQIGVSLRLLIDQN